MLKYLEEELHLEWFQGGSLVDFSKCLILETLELAIRVRINPSYYQLSMRGQSWFLDAWRSPSPQSQQNQSIWKIPLMTGIRPNYLKTMLQRNLTKIKTLIITELIKMMVAQCSQSLRHLGHELRDKEVQVQLTSSPPARPCPPQHWAPATCSCAPSWPQWGSNQSPAPSADATLQIFMKKT